MTGKEQDFWNVVKNAGFLLQANPYVVAPVVPQIWYAGLATWLGQEIRSGADFTPGTSTTVNFFSYLQQRPANFLAGMVETPPQMGIGYSLEDVRFAYRGRGPSGAGYCLDLVMPSESSKFTLAARRFPANIFDFEKFSTRITPTLKSWKPP